MLTDAEARERAAVIRKQLGVFGLGVVGASKIAYTAEGGLTFVARLHFKGQSRVRVCRVTVTLNARDLYDVLVEHPDRQATFANMYGDDLTSLMYRIDSEGF
jgi:hypothetical protein